MEAPVGTCFELCVDLIKVKNLGLINVGKNEALKQKKAFHSVGSYKGVIYVLFQTSKEGVK